MYISIFIHIIYINQINTFYIEKIVIIGVYFVVYIEAESVLFLLLCLSVSLYAHRYETTIKDNVFMLSPNAIGGAVSCLFFGMDDNMVFVPFFYIFVIFMLF